MAKSEHATSIRKPLAASTSSSRVERTVEFAPSHETILLVRCTGALILIFALVMTLTVFDSMVYNPKGELSNPTWTILYGIVPAALLSILGLWVFFWPIDGLKLDPATRSAEFIRQWPIGTERDVVAFEDIELVGVVTHSIRSGQVSSPFLQIAGRTDVIELSSLGQGTGFDEASMIADRISKVTGARRKPGGRGRVADYFVRAARKPESRAA